MVYFLSNKYSSIYYSIINRAQTRILTEYKERHHIIPQCMGGTNDKSNLVDLTAREHFIAHLLLTKMVDDVNHLTSLKFALAKFRQCNSKQKRYVFNSWEFEQVRKAHAEAARESMTGRKFPPKSLEYRKKLSAIHKGKPSPLQGRIGATKGKKLTEEHRLHISKGSMGKIMNISDKERSRRSIALKENRKHRKYAPLSQEVRLKISIANKGKIPHNKGQPAPQFICPHCRKIIRGANNFYRWHDNNCKIRSGAYK